MRLCSIAKLSLPTLPPSNSTPHRLRSGGYPSNLIMTTIEETLKHDLITRLTAPIQKTERAHCMTCGPGLDPAKAAKGGQARFCSGCCMDAYDAGWPVYGTTIADYATRPVATRPRLSSVTKRSRKHRSDAGKPRKRVLKAGSEAFPSAAENAKWTPRPIRE
jgi:hypothetical protein